jgi:TrmH family RNA methyltransferase
MVGRMRERGQGDVAVDGPLSNIRVVLVRPRGGADVGAAARAMKNMGMGALTLVRPAVRRFRAAEAMAVHAHDVLRRARVVADLAAAVGDCGLVVGTTCRGGPYRAGAEDAETLAPHLLAAAAQGPVAVLFGPEDHGLTNDDLRHCQRLIAIDTSLAYPSLNLAQTVLLVCYALRRAATAGTDVPRVRSRAPAAAVQRMFDHLQRALLRIGFLHPQNPEHLMFALRRLFGRGGLEDHEVRILLGIARQIDWAAGQIGAGDVQRSAATARRPRVSSHG